jgi:hypothetical protein
MGKVLQGISQAGESGAGYRHFSHSFTRDLKMEDEGSLQFIFHSQVLMSRAISLLYNSTRTQQIRVTVAQ